jgi:predicted RNA-binding protein
MIRGETEEMVMANVNVLEPRGDHVFLSDIFGDQKLIRARLKTTSLLEHRIILEELPPAVQSS